MNIINLENQDRLRIYNSLASLSNDELIEFCTSLNIKIPVNINFKINRKKCLKYINKYCLSFNIKNFIISKIFTIKLKKLKSLIQKQFSHITFTKSEKHIFEYFMDYTYDLLNTSLYEDICSDCNKFLCTDLNNLKNHISEITYNYCIEKLNILYNTINKSNKEDVNTIFTLFKTDVLHFILIYYNIEIYEHFKLVNCYYD